MKLIAIDLDGTLLSKDTGITQENLQAIRKAQSQGHIVMICSGRAPEDIQQILKKYELSCPLAGSNGSVVQAEGKLLGMVSMNRENIIQIAKRLDDERVPYRIYTNHGIFVPEDWTERVNLALQGDTIKVEGLSDEVFRRITEQPQQSDLIKYFHDYNEWFGTKDMKIQKFFILTLNREKKSELTAYLSNIPGVATTSSGQMNIEVMDVNGNKGNALKIMAEYYGISLADTVAIGDNFNDIPMLKVAGFSIAMGNADPAVKQLCNFVTLSNAENGVSYAIDKFILNHQE
jgi:Cof subfamily protein (haloacid dehalogenase superfamily)